MGSRETEPALHNKDAFVLYTHLGLYWIAGKITVRKMK
jgi:hypothetical protein